MADISITVANVLASVTSPKKQGTAGETIIQGKTVARDTDGSIKLCDANAAAPINKLVGISLNSALTGQPIDYVIKDPNFKTGATHAIGDIVIVSGTPGGIAPVADKATGWFPTYIGEAIDTTHINFDPHAGGVASA